MAFHTAGAINCADIVPVDGLLAASRIPRSVFEAQVDAAFAAWAAVADITFTRIADPAAADIVIGAEGVAGGRAFTNVATALGGQPTLQNVGGVATGRAAISRSLICLNAQQPWKVGFDGNLKVYDLRYALMHEIGHAIGLDHPDSPNAVMDFHYTEAFSSLQPGDIAGAVALYGARRSLTTVAAAPLRASAPADGR